MVESIEIDRDFSNAGGHEKIMGFLGRQQNTWASYITKNAVGKPQHAELVGPQSNPTPTKHTPCMCMFPLCEHLRSLDANASQTPSTK